MTYEDLKSIIDEKRNSDEEFISALDLYNQARTSLIQIHSVLSDDLFISSMNYLHGYGKKYLKRIAKIDGKPSPFITGVQYYTGKREEDNKMMFLLISSDKVSDKRTVLEVFTKNNELNYKLHFDHKEDKEKDSHIIKYSETFIKSFKDELIEKLNSIKMISEVYDVTLNGFDIHAGDKYQVINDGVLKVTFQTTCNETDLNINIDFNDPNLSRIKNTIWFTKSNLSNYIKNNEKELLSKIKVDPNELNNYYKRLYSMVQKQDKKHTLSLHK